MGEREKKGRRKSVRRMKKKGATRGKEKRRKKRNKTESVERRFEDFVSVEASEIIGQGGDLESCGGLSWEYLLEKPEF